MDDNNFQNSLCITSMKQKLSGPTEAHGPFIYIMCYYSIIHSVVPYINSYKSVGETMT